MVKITRANFFVNFIICILLILITYDGVMGQGGTDRKIKSKTFEEIPESKTIGSGPRYWIAYEYCWTHNQAIPEDVWKNNIDWVYENLKSYGYDMISNDGWIEEAQTINEDGYILKYNDNWHNGFEYWAEYLTKKDMKLGVYYNPLWLTKKALSKNVTIKGTSFKANDVIGDKSFNSELNWVDVEKPGAKEWIQGYVNYFKDMGINYLRIDFLENYENNYGKKKYVKALKWIREAAGDSMFLSLVMPNCFNHCETEIKYGDMLRISDDCFDGGWDFVSERLRGMHKSNWPQYGNTFDGFISFSDLSGPNKMILDGDFIRLNTLKNEEEKKLQISLFVMAGSPIAVADQFNSIGENLKFYQNKELLKLNDIGFVAKPISNNIHDKVNSSRWIGKMPNGDWVIGLFNREDNAEIRSINFIDELGLEKDVEYTIRDLWEHESVGEFSKEYSALLKPHSCKILRIQSGTKN